jgi:hypothetical protein
MHRRTRERLPGEPLGHDDVRLLRAAASRFGEAERERKAALFASAARRDIADAGVLVAWHDCLLYLLAYPESAALHRSAQAELRRVAGIARRMTTTGPARERRRLEGSGIAWSMSTFAFGWDVARWLAARFPRRCDVDSFGDDGTQLSEVLGAALPRLEFALLAEGEDANTLLDDARGRLSRIEWLVAQLGRLPCSDAVRALLFDSLKAYLVLRPGASPLSRTYVRGLPAPVFLHRAGLTRDIDLPLLLGQRLPPARPLNARLRLRAIDAACAMLASLGRETDAIALTYPGGVEWHDLGRGIAVALYAMRPDRRDALDSHVGMMLFKNRLPVGYGGGWPFAGTCRIGINIFEPYRGGESALLFGQVLRVYCQRFGITRFIVEPTQFGGTNTEGLRSGAFWFYHRLGFRPVDALAAQRAQQEHARMLTDSGYRTPIPKLRRFAGSDLELRIGGDDDLSSEPAHLSAAVTAWINARFDGDRRAAEAAAVRAVAIALDIADIGTWSQAEQRALIALAPLLVQIPGLADWSVADRQRLIALIRAKGGDEFRFHRRLNRHRALRLALSSLSAQSA